MRILIVEDEPKLAEALREGLEREGYQVSVAATGEEGFFLMGTQAFDLMSTEIAPGQNAGPTFEYHPVL